MLLRVAAFRGLAIRCEVPGRRLLGRVINVLGFGGRLMLPNTRGVVTNSSGKLLRTQTVPGTPAFRVPEPRELATDQLLA